MVYQPNYERIAQKIVKESLRVQPGEQVVIDVRADAVPYGEQIAVEIFKAGGVAALILHSDELKYHQIMDTPTEQLALPERPAIAATGAADFNINVGLFDAEPDRFRDLPDEKMRAYEMQRQHRRPALYGREGARWLGTDYPTRYMAQLVGMTWTRFFEMFWRAMDIDYGDLRERAEEVAERLASSTHIQITTPRGTDLSLQRGERAIHKDDGIIRTLGNLPAGEVYFAPVEESAEGRLVADQGYFQFERISGLEFQIEGGVLTPLKAAQGFDLFMHQWELATGDKDHLGEIGIGINPELHTATGYPLTDDKVEGIVHLTLGRNDLTGGTNRSSFRWPVLLTQATIKLDDRLLLDKGRLVRR
ncbi:MAG: aminopeptidase [Ardenticatenales bacterium]|nr:aminopeptidase [Ardenticatenales bacterium]